MLYLGEAHLREIGFDWRELADAIEDAVAAIDDGAFAQPLKPYLRFGNPANRIIAMPAYLGGDIHVAGLKWIASFPGNLDLRLPRAHSVTLLNDADTGAPTAIVNTASVSAARTAAVSGMMLRHWLRSRSAEGTRLRIGIIGWGPIGRFHYEMCKSLFGERIDCVSLYDIRGVSLESETDEGWRRRIKAADSWEQLYAESNVVITCTVSHARYIHTPPAPGTLLLDVSLRDYGIEAIKDVRAVVVDNWSEVCRENTDIELLHKEAGLRQELVMTLGDVVRRSALEPVADTEPVLFCPMGMAVFDVAVANGFVKKGLREGIGLMLP